MTMTMTMTITDKIRITCVEQDGEDGVIVTFSDKTTGAYAVEELLSLRSIREPVTELESQNLTQMPKT
jgi:thiamine phosphate synthase YjbQ (UPF0047 family)